MWTHAVHHCGYIQSRHATGRVLATAYRRNTHGSSLPNSDIRRMAVWKAAGKGVQDRVAPGGRIARLDSVEIRLRQ
ncbi:hypothetical protein C0Z16_35775 [Paraburkholderia rhynchosiae]|uniref:Uncharacterized protein n=1 Tax=Paraburkholderia rhynchosiae TaxID=487049 RepID=A0ABX4UUR6_9BURK|nr:hypothetical protein C0Z16_35775 [Paraburkholderia rhynchosiae]